MSLSTLYILWTRLVELLETGASIYDEEVDRLVDEIENRFGNAIEDAAQIRKDQGG